MGDGFSIIVHHTTHAPSGKPGVCDYASLFIESWEAARRNDAELIVVSPHSSGKASRIRASGFVQSMYGSRGHAQTSRAVAFNAGARLASNRRLIFHDIDVILPPDFFDRVDEWSQRDNRAFLNWSRMFKFRNHETTKLIENGGDRVLLANAYAREFGQFDDTDEMGVSETTRVRTPEPGWTGYMNCSTTIDADLFWSVGGYSASVGFGRDDAELFMRLLHIGEDIVDQREPGDLWRFGPPLMPVYMKRDGYSTRDKMLTNWTQARRWFNRTDDNAGTSIKTLRAVQRARD